MSVRRTFSLLWFLIQAVILLSLAGSIAYGAWYWADKLFLAPNRLLASAKKEPPPPPPTDPALGEYQQCLEVEKRGNVEQTRRVFFGFLEQNPDSTKADDVRNRLSRIHTAMYLSSAPAPEKITYLVKRGDVITRVANKNGTTPELIMRLNGMTREMLRYDETLLILPSKFTLTISKPKQRVWLEFNDKFFKQYPITVMPSDYTPPPLGSAKTVLKGRVTDKLAFGPDGGRIIFTDKGFSEATHWVAVSIPKHTLYSDTDLRSGEKTKPPPQGGLGLAPNDMAELAALLPKGAKTTVE